MNNTIQADDIRHNNWVLIHKDLCADEVGLFVAGEFRECKLLLNDVCIKSMVLEQSV